jgi:hypothetical protein
MCSESLDRTQNTNSARRHSKIPRDRVLADDQDAGIRVLLGTLCSCCSLSNCNNQQDTLEALELDLGTQTPRGKSDTRLGPLHNKHKKMRQGQSLSTVRCTAASKVEHGTSASKVEEKNQGSRCQLCTATPDLFQWDRQSQWGKECNCTASPVSRCPARRVFGHSNLCAGICIQANSLCTRPRCPRTMTRCRMAKMAGLWTCKQSQRDSFGRCLHFLDSMILADKAPAASSLRADNWSPRDKECTPRPRTKSTTLKDTVQATSAYVGKLNLADTEHMPFGLSNTSLQHTQWYLSHPCTPFQADTQDNGSGCPLSTFQSCTVASTRLHCTDPLVLIHR